MKLYFEIGEFLVTKCECDLKPLYQHLLNLKRMAIVLSVVRALVGCPIVITSGFRSKKLNEIVGGVDNSYHLQGRAADITCKDMPKLLDICTTLFEQGIFIECIYYPQKNIIHVAI